ncbi:Aliphatic sulfonate ABC transporter substrate-binding protein OS=Streptomyces tendae OX=1932 GN=GUR47_23355 PE=4 SV=1 [Streptomyces tendae]
MRFGYINDFNGASLIAIAEAKGLWKKHGLSADAKVFTNGPLQIQALGTNNLDFGYIGPGAMWLPASGQAKVVAINTLGNSDGCWPSRASPRCGSSRARPSPYPRDLRRHDPLARPGEGRHDQGGPEGRPDGPVHHRVRLLLPAGRRQPGFWYPAAATIKKQVPDLVELAKNADFEADVSFPTAFVAGNKVVADQPEKTKKVLAVLREVMTFRSEHTDEAIKLTAGKLKIPVAQVQADAARNNKVLSVAELDKLTRTAPSSHGWRA